VFGPWVMVGDPEHVVHDEPPPPDVCDAPFVCPCSPAWRCVGICRPPVAEYDDVWDRKTVGSMT